MAAATLLWPSAVTQAGTLARQAETLPAAMALRLFALCLALALPAAGAFVLLRRHAGVSAEGHRLRMWGQFALTAPVVHTALRVPQVGVPVREAWFALVGATLAVSLLRSVIARGGSDAPRLAASPSAPLRRVHRWSAVVIATFATLHIAGHLTAFVSLELNLSVVDRLRSIYKQPLLEGLLLAAVPGAGRDRPDALPSRSRSPGWLLPSSPARVGSVPGRVHRGARHGDRRALPQYHVLLRDWRDERRLHGSDLHDLLHARAVRCLRARRVRPACDARAPVRPGARGAMGRRDACRFWRCLRAHRARVVRRPPDKRSSASRRAQKTGSCSDVAGFEAEPCTRRAPHADRRRQSVDRLARASRARTTRWSGSRM